jgi:lipopolysaccharide biosynthesis glycosyltransferase
MKKNKNVKLAKKNKKTIPIFFSTDDNYIPFVEIACRSLKENASKKYNYMIHVLNTGIKPENQEIVKRLNGEGFTVEFNDVTDFVEPVKNRFRNLYHFTIAMYYRIFIEKLFPQYKKAIYLDCDIVVLGDISKMYNIQLGDNLVGAVADQLVPSVPLFVEYCEKCVGVNPASKYFSSGILLMNLEEFRKQHIVDKFIYLMNTYNFDTVDPDQAYLNFLCYGKVKHLPNGWNKQSCPGECEGPLNIVHYALYKKPWQYDGVLNEEYFWKYAKESPCIDKIMDMKNSFTDEMKKAREEANVNIVVHAGEILKNEKTFYNCLLRDGNWLDKVKFNEIGDCFVSDDAKIEA